MAGKRTSIHGQWSSRWAFILACTGSAVGLGNIWRFPYTVGENGGGAFVLLYLGCVIILGIPVMMSEVMLGRRGRQTPLNTMRTLSEEEGVSRHWQILGIVGIAAGFMILSYYSVIAGWTLAYILRSGAGAFQSADAEVISGAFSALISDPEKLLAWHTIFMILCTIVVSRGVKNGIEEAVKFLMPSLFILLLIMVGYAMSTDKFMEGLAYLFVPDFSKITENFKDVFLNALGQAFFSLSIGMGAVMMYGSYLSDKESIPRTSAAIAFADTLVAILAGIAIFPIVFSYGLEPSEGPGLIFVTLPIAFGQMPGGLVFGTIFFFLLMFAAWTSGMSLMEPPVTWLVENKGMNRVKAASTIGISIWLLGMFTVLSFNYWAFDFSIFGQAKSNGIFDMLDFTVTNVMLPMGALAILFFASWIIPESTSREEMNMHETLFQAWRIMARYVAPFGILLIFLQAVGIL
jgi:NSS family neurotransmitter:Na+ symporter